MINQNHLTPVFAALLAVFACSSCATSKQQRLYSTSLRSSYSNAFLWRQVKKDPTVYHPNELPLDYKINEKSAEWVIDKKTQTSFLVPYRECAGISPAGWRAEAQKAVRHLYQPDPPKRADDFKDETSTESKATRIGLAILAFPFEMIGRGLAEGLIGDNDDDDFMLRNYGRRRGRGKDKGKDDKKDDCPPADNDSDDDKDDCPEPSETGKP